MTTPRHWFTALVLGSLLLTTWVPAQTSDAFNECQIEFREATQAAKDLPRGVWDDRLEDDLRRINERRTEAQAYLKEFQKNPVRDPQTDGRIETIKKKIADTEKTILKHRNGPNSAVLKRANITYWQHYACLQRSLLRLSTDNAQGSTSPSTADGNNQISRYRGPTPQSGEECMAMVRGTPKEKGFKDPVDQIQQHLGCLAEWKKIRQAQQQNTQLPQSGGNTPEQQMTQQAAAQARETQAKGDADAKRQGRRRHDPAMEANDCISIDTSKPGFGLFRNSCNFKVEVAWCNENPKKDSWADVHNCIGKGGQMTGVRANGESASHIKNTERVHWLACKEPALPLEVTFDGTQLQGRCRVLFGD